VSGRWEFSEDGTEYRWVSDWKVVHDLTRGEVAHEYGCRAGGDMDRCTCPNRPATNLSYLAWHNSGERNS
jgi:hypothetical protein